MTPAQPPGQHAPSWSTGNPRPALVSESLAVWTSEFTHSFDSVIQLVECLDCRPHPGGKVSSAREGLRQQVQEDPMWPPDLWVRQLK